MTINSSTKYALTFLAGSLPVAYLSSDAVQETNSANNKQTAIMSIAEYGDASLPPIINEADQSANDPILSKTQSEVSSAREHVKRAQEDLLASRENISKTEEALDAVDARIPGLITKAQTVQQENEQLQTEKTGLSGSMQELEAKLTKIETEREDLIKILESKNEEVGANYKEIKKLEAQIYELKVKLGYPVIERLPQGWPDGKGGDWGDKSRPL